MILAERAIEKSCQLPMARVWFPSAEWIPRIGRLPKIRKGSRMSRLPLFERLDTHPRLRVVRDENEAVILPFLRRSWRNPLAESLRPSGWRTTTHQPPVRTTTHEPPFPSNRMDPLTRARVLHDNRCCPSCRRGGVMPLDLGDGDDRHRAMPVPGSSTLVGFCCNSCGAEWPV
jgi:hypothetical protein